MAARARSLLAAALCGLLAGAPGCVQNDGSSFNPLKKMTEVTPDQERDIGLKFDRELQKQVEFVDDPVVLAAVNDLGQDLVKRIEPQPFVYRFRVIKDDRLNAFAVPGGFIYLHSATVVKAGSLDELAGVLAHEIGHVKGHHFQRMQEKAALPSLLAGLAAIGAAMATHQPGAAITAQAVNEAIQLKFSREFENEADELGTIFMARAGYDPRGMSRFFERIVLEEERNPIQIPPYLYSHPDVKDRIATVNAEAAALTVQGAPPVGFDDELREAQARLALLLKSGRSSLAETAPPFDRSKTDPALAEADQLAAAENGAGAIERLTRAEADEPNDPRVSFRLGELYEAQGQPADAIAAWRRTLRLDPNRGLVFYKIGLAYRELGDRPQAVFYLEQALRRFGGRSELQKRTEAEIERLDFRVIEAAGLSDAAAGQEGGPLRQEFPASVAAIQWWAKLGERFIGREKQLRVRWIDPSGGVVLDAPVARERRPYVGSRLALGDLKAAMPGLWTVEAELDHDVVDRRSFRLTPGS